MPSLAFVRPTRRYIAQTVRDNLRAHNGHDYEKYSDAEMLGSILYNLFLNFSVWSGMTPTRVYRWRPNGRDVDSAIMEIYQLDMGNLPYVQEGLKTSGNNLVRFANYQDMHIRQHDIMIQRWRVGLIARVLTWR